MAGSDALFHASGSLSSEIPLVNYWGIAADVIQPCYNTPAATEFKLKRYDLVGGSFSKVPVPESV